MDRTDYENYYRNTRFRNSVWFLIDEEIEMVMIALHSNLSR